MLAAAFLGLLYLDRQEAVALLSRWKPQVVSGNLVSLTGVKSYARARVLLERKETSALVHVSPQNTLDLFVINTAANQTIIEAAVWHSSHQHRVNRFHRLRHWHMSHFPDSTLLGGVLLDGTDLVQWIISEYDV